MHREFDRQLVCMWIEASASGLIPFAGARHYQECQAMTFGRPGV